MESKKIEDLTIDEIKEQMALYQRLYYHRMKEDPEYMERKREYWRERKRAEKAKKMATATPIEKPKIEPSNRKYKGDNFILLTPVS